ncbi:protein-glutamine glutaminase family protein [Saccharopolyspora spinosporotrichia]
MRPPLIVVTKDDGASPSTGLNARLLDRLRELTGPRQTFEYSGYVDYQPDGKDGHVQSGVIGTAKGVGFTAGRLGPDDVEYTRRGDVFDFATDPDDPDALDELDQFAAGVEKKTADMDGLGTPLVVSVVAMDDGFARVRLPDGTEADLGGRELAKLLLADPEFRARLTADPAPSVLLLGENTGSRDDIGGFGFDFAGGLHEAGIYNDVIGTKGVAWFEDSKLQKTPTTTFANVSRLRAGDLKTAALYGKDGRLVAVYLRVRGDDKVLSNLQDWAKDVTPDSLAEVIGPDGNSVAALWAKDNPPVLVITHSVADKSAGQSRIYAIRNDDRSIFLRKFSLNGAIHDELADALRDDPVLREGMGNYGVGYGRGFLLAGFGEMDAKYFANGISLGGYARAVYYGRIATRPGGRLAVGQVQELSALFDGKNVASQVYKDVLGPYGQAFHSQDFDAARGMTDHRRRIRNRPGYYFIETTDSSGNTRKNPVAVPWQGRAWHWIGHGTPSVLQFGMRTGNPYVRGDAVLVGAELSADAFSASTHFSRAMGMPNVFYHCNANSPDDQSPDRVTVARRIMLEWEKKTGQPVPALYAATGKVANDFRGGLVVKDGGQFDKVRDPNEPGITPVPLSNQAAPPAASLVSGMTWASDTSTQAPEGQTPEQVGERANRSAAEEFDQETARQYVRQAWAANLPVSGRQVGAEFERNESEHVGETATDADHEMVVLGPDGSRSTRRLSWPTPAPAAGATSAAPAAHSMGSGSASADRTAGDVDALSARRAEFIAGLLKFEEPDTGAVLGELGRLRGDAAEIRGLRSAFWQHTGRELDSVLSEHLSPAQFDHALTMLGFRNDFSTNPAHTPPKVVASPGQKLSELPQVRAFAEQLRAHVEADEFDEALVMLRGLDRNLRAVWAVQEAYHASGSRILGVDLIKLRPEHSHAVLDALAFVNDNAVSLEQAIHWHERLKTSTFEHHSRGTVPIRIDYPDQGCNIRAHLWSLDLQRMGAQPSKVFVTRSNPKLTITSANAADATPGVPGTVSWRYHVAPSVVVHTPQGTQNYVLDPTLSGTPLPVSDWLAMMGVDISDESGTMVLGGSPRYIQEVVDRHFLDHPDQWETVDGLIFPTQKAFIVFGDPSMLGWPMPLVNVTSRGSFKAADDMIRAGFEGELIEANEEAERRAQQRQRMVDLMTLMGASHQAGFNVFSADPSDPNSLSYNPGKFQEFVNEAIDPNLLHIDPVHLNAILDSIDNGFPELLDTTNVGINPELQDLFAGTSAGFDPNALGLDLNDGVNPQDYFIAVEHSADVMDLDGAESDRMNLDVSAEAPVHGEDGPGESAAESATEEFEADEALTLDEQGNQSTRELPRLANTPSGASVVFADEDNTAGPAPEQNQSASARRAALREKAREEAREVARKEGDPHAGEIVVLGEDGSLSTRKLSWPTLEAAGPGVTSEGLPAPVRGLARILPPGRPVMWTRCPRAGRSSSPICLNSRNDDLAAARGRGRQCDGVLPAPGRAHGHLGRTPIRCCVSWVGFGVMRRRSAGCYPPSGSTPARNSIRS